MERLAADLLIQLINGFTYGMILALVASGFTLVLGVLNIVNFAHGELYMLGAYVGWASALLLQNFWLAVGAAGLILLVLGMGLERVLIRPVRRRGPLDPLLLTFGLSLIFQQAALIVFGPIGKHVPMPIEVQLPFFRFGYPAYRLVVMLVALGLILGLWVFLRRSRYGMFIRATVQDREMAAAMGVPVPRLYMLVFGIGSGIAGVSGVLMSPLFGVYHTMGLDIIISSFIVVVVGGMGSLPGSIVAGLLIGELESLGSLFLKPIQAQILSLLMLLMVLAFRPQGLLGRRSLGG